MLPKDRNYDKKILRIWTILNKLDSRRKVSTRELSEEFNVSYRTIQRDLKLLDMAGFPMVTIDRGHHTFMEGFSLKRMEMSKEEASLLSFLYEIASSLGDNFEESFREIFRKVLMKEADSPFYVKLPEGEKLDEKIPYIKEIKAAIEDFKKIKLDYTKQDGQKRLKVHPLKIMFFDGFWYLLSRIDGKKWIVTLKMENICNLKVLDDYFEEPKNLKTLLEKSVNIWFSEKRDKKVVLKVDKEVAGYFKQRTYFPLQKIKKENKDGSLVIESKVGNYMEVVPNVLKWIPYVAAMEPEDFKKDIKARIKRYLQKI